jgi:hypothetical protein
MKFLSVDFFRRFSLRDILGIVFLEDDRWRNYSTLEGWMTFDNFHPQKNFSCSLPYKIIQ